MLLGGAFRGARRESFLFQGEQCLVKACVCARGPRGRLRVVGWTENRSTALVNQRVTLSFGEALRFLLAEGL